MILTVLSFVVALGLLIAVHEYGHYRVAVAFGVPVLVFSIGFGKTIYKWRPRKQHPGQNTEFRICALPLGGFVQMLDSREGSVPPEQLPLAFDHQSLKARASIVAAGPLANLLLAVALFTGLSWWGQPKVLPVIGKVEAGAIAPGLDGKPKTFDFYFGNTGLVDVFSKEGTAWFEGIYNELADYGVAGWWGDLGEPEVHPSDTIHSSGTADEIHNVYGHRWAELVYQNRLEQQPAQRQGQGRAEHGAGQEAGQGRQQYQPAK